MGRRKAPSLSFSVRPSITVPQRLVVVSHDGPSYRFLWPYIVSRRVPEAFPFCEWLADRGASVIGGLQIARRKSGRWCVVAIRPIKQRTALASIPLSTSLRAACVVGDNSLVDIKHQLYFSLVNDLVRELNNRHGDHQPYVDFLRSIHCERTTASFDLSMVSRGQEAWYGVKNAPFLHGDDLSTSQQRLEWRRLLRLQRQLQQSVPHFAVPSVPWALSIVLSRSIFGEGMSSGAALLPFIDLCSHSYSPSAVIQGDGASGVRWHDSSSQCVHLVAARDILQGEEVSVTYSSRRADAPADRDFWKLHWGFVPQ